MRSRLWTLFAVLPLAIACSHAQTKPAEAPQAPQAPVAAAAEESPATPLVSAPRSCTSDDQCGKSEICVNSTCVAASESLCQKESVHFAFDKADLGSEDRASLQRTARCLEALPAMHTIVAGNCDERGTAEYNVALGSRRAHAVAAYLTDLGVSPAQLDEVSYGKELPVCRESSEACWAKNRRADITRGGEKQNLTKLLRKDEARLRSAKNSAETATP